MANAGTGLWLIESNAVDNDDWITDHAGDPEDSDYSKFTEGTDIITFIDFYGIIEQAPAFVADYEDIPGWKFIDMSIEEGHDMYKISGTFQGTTFALTQAKEDLLQQFFRLHSDLGDNAFNVVRRWATDVYKKYPDKDRTLQKYCPVRFVKAPTTKIVERVLEFSFVVRSAWAV